jgi:hypothetical protein
MAEVFLAGLLWVIVCALLFSASGRRLTYQLLHNIASRPALSVGINAALAIVLCVSYGMNHGFPYPRIHDEFSYLLAGDTLAHGRLANPPHACWEHFESMHIIHQPSYASKYPLGQGVAIAIGYLIGHPILGVWLSMAAACGALCWMLQQWLKSHWGFLASLIGTTRLCTADYPKLWIPEPNYWCQSYWGGAVALLGGSLMFGSMGQCRRRVTVGSSVVFAIGMVVLSHSRPLEGLLVTIPCLLCYFVYWIRPSDRQLKPLFALLAISIFNAGLIGSQNLVVTGKISKLPHTHYEEQNSLTPMTLLGDVREEGQPNAPIYRHEIIRQYNAGWQLAMFQRQLDWSEYVAVRQETLDQLWEFFLGPVLSIPVLLFLLIPKPPRYWLTIPICLLPLAAYLITPWMHPHYLAPVAGLPYLWVGACIQWASQLKYAGAALGVICGIGLLTIDSMHGLDSPYANRLESLQQVSPRNRAELEQELIASGGEHLILVSYASAHSVHAEWVYNAADIDKSQVLWARDMGEANARLFEYFPNRKVTKIQVQGWSYQRLKKELGNGTVGRDAVPE